MKKTPKAERLVSFENFSYGVEARVESCNHEFIRLIVLEDGCLELTRRLRILISQRETVKSALEISKNFFDMNEGRLMTKQAQRPLLSEVA